MEIDELAREYESKSDEELLRLTLDRADLTSEANSALNIELSKRNIDRPEALEAFRQEEWRRKKDLEKIQESCGSFITMEWAKAFRQG